MKEIPTINAVLGLDGSKPSYQPRILCFPVVPGLEPELYYPMLSLVDVIIIETVPTGGVPAEGKYSFIPFIRKATELRKPVFLLRGTTSASRKPEHEQRSYRRSLESLYAPELYAIRGGEKPTEIDALKSGGTPLERPDVSQILEVVERIRGVYAERPPYHEGIKKVSEIFSSPEFMEQIRRIRE
jgi:hypothetical protein